jgi:hypothetical protein
VIGNYKKYSKLDMLSQSIYADCLTFCDKNMTKKVG